MHEHDLAWAGPGYAREHMVGGEIHHGECCACFEGPPNREPETRGPPHGPQPGPAHEPGKPPGPVRRRQTRDARSDLVDLTSDLVAHDGRKFRGIRIETLARE